MADSTPEATTSNATRSYFLPTVTLFDWWLVKSPDNRLSISGISSRKGEAIRVFNSSPIVKRFDVYSLETADGISVLIRGIINEERTLENGFTPQIINSFYIGFPPNWESCGLDCIREVEPGTDSVNAAMDTVSAICEDILSVGKCFDDRYEEKSSILSELAEEAPENNQTPFPGDECVVSEEMSGVNVASGSVGNRRSTRLLNINVCQQKIKKKKQKQKQQPTSRGPLKHSHEEPSSTSKAVENCDLDTAHLDNVSANLPEISSGAVENSFPTSSVTPEKAMGHCNKLFFEGEEYMSVKTSEANVVHVSGRIRRSARLHNVKSFQKNQPATGGPATCLAKDQISAAATIEKSDGGLENLLTPAQSQSGIVNTLSGQVTNKLRSKTSSAKTEVGHKNKRVTVETEAVNPKRQVMKPSSSVKSPQGRNASHLIKGSKQGLSIVSPESVGHKNKRVTFETEAVNPKRKVMKPSSSVKSPQGRDASHLNKGSKQGLSIVSPESVSQKRSRSGRLLLPSLEFWRNEIPIYNVDREIKEIQQDLTMTSPFRGFSPAPGRF